MNIYGLLRSPDCNTEVLRKVCAALDYDFFEMLSRDVRTKGGDQLADPTGSYASVGRSPMRIVIEVDPSDEQARANATQMAADLLRDRKV